MNNGFQTPKAGCNLLVVDAMCIACRKITLLLWARLCTFLQTGEGKETGQEDPGRLPEVQVEEEWYGQLPAKRDV